MATRQELIRLIFGEDYLEIIETSSSIEKTLGVYEYGFMSQSEYQKLGGIDPLEAMRIYWLEILYRCHFCASTTLMRTNRWLNGVISAVEDGNYFSFCANLRGLLESSADSCEGIGNVAPSLAPQFKAIRRILKKDPQINRIFSPEIENQLIHFSHGRKVGKGEEVPESHKAKHVRDYLELLIGADDTVLDLYGHLCEVTHPASSSISGFASVTPEGDVHLIVPDDRRLIAGVISDYLEDPWYLFKLSINPALALLKFLNHFNEKGMYTASVEHVDLTKIPSWIDISEYIT